MRSWFYENIIIPFGEINLILFESLGGIKLPVFYVFL